MNPATAGRLLNRRDRRIAGHRVARRRVPPAQTLRVGAAHRRPARTGHRHVIASLRAERIIVIGMGCQQLPQTHFGDGGQTEVGCKAQPATSAAANNGFLCA